MKKDNINNNEEKIHQKPLMEELYKEELEALKKEDKNNKPKNWNLSPQAVRDFILGKKLKSGVEIKRKFYGDDSLVERAIITLAGNRGLMLVGEPGTAKTMLSELLSAAISGNSTVTIQGTAGTNEDNIKYSWNYAMLFAKGPVEEALIPSPVYTGMNEGIITRFEEITRCPLEIQDSLISILSDKIMNIPEQNRVLFANAGFNIIATANTRDKGINEMSSALKRRFNFETVEPIKNPKLEGEIITNQCQTLLELADIDIDIEYDVVDILATTFNELRSGKSFENAKIQELNSVMSTAEAVSVYYQSALHSYYYGDKNIKMETIVGNLIGSVAKENKDDIPKLKNYFNNSVKIKAEKFGKKWKDYYESKNLIK
ncbi:AAA family ATPase [Brachyspira hyodysenteriae]|uniref:ATP-binding protein n=1 Tax=Brachyspira hyodysenteriae TaxID=159 RepID=UPI001ADD6827|nr:AAA family ATPase [Brachyspira hyodysenteriae]MBT8720753.1 AAA family ATPase [Brachyspira hyodysenteriae]MBT8730918.1 AAA family ATPase [Brachyspira hyodysenteriae]MBT8733366.1 AAA family ATPase [Brachyspira hyodysenteriae]MBT8736018.1 AAA family ATPase [Brachyspira hyodysenteriae]MBT8739084.1 AAA family ATPase [Brachyspira hyodysenteriae]